MDIHTVKKQNIRLGRFHPFHWEALEHPTIIYISYDDLTSFKKSISRCLFIWNWPQFWPLFTLVLWEWWVAAYFSPLFVVLEPSTLYKNTNNFGIWDLKQSLFLMVFNSLFWLTIDLINTEYTLYRLEWVHTKYWMHKIHEVLEMWGNIKD